MYWVVMGTIEFLFSGQILITEAYSNHLFYLEVPAWVKLPAFLPGDLVLADFTLRSEDLECIYSGKLLKLEILDEAGEFTLSAAPPSQRTPVPDIAF